MTKPSVVNKHKVVLLEAVVWYPDKEDPFSYSWLIHPEVLKEKALREFYTEDLKSWLDRHFEREFGDQVPQELIDRLVQRELGDG